MKTVILYKLNLHIILLIAIVLVSCSQGKRLMKDGAAEKDLISQLVAQLVMITAQNPSYTLDNKSHEDSSPLLKVFEKYLPWFGGKKDK